MEVQFAERFGAEEIREERLASADGLDPILGLSIESIVEQLGDAFDLLGALVHEGLNLAFNAGRQRSRGLVLRGVFGCGDRRQFEFDSSPEAFFGEDFQSWIGADRDVVEFVLEQARLPGFGRLVGFHQDDLVRPADFC